jgi:two-component system phosphate regulon sensor histidine kinase PhoR
LGLRAKILVASLALVSVPTIVVFTYARVEIEKTTVASVESDLRHRVALGLTTSSHWPKGEPQGDAWQRVVTELATASGARVTIIRHDGLVLGDSGVAKGRLASVENHRSRPEVQDALSHGVGIERRHSLTTKHDSLYLAMPFGEPKQPDGVLRMALELSAVEREVASLQRSVGVGALLALLLAVIAAGRAASWVTHGTRALIAAARRMSDGDLETHVPESEQSDLAELSRTLEQLARSLSSTLRELRTERDWMGGILSRMREGVILLGADGRIQMTNPALREMLLVNEDVVGQTLSDTVRHGEFRKLLEQVLEVGKAESREIEIGGLMPRQLLVRAAPLGADHSVFAVVLDVTEMRRLESLRKDFVANVSHELRTPVTAIRSAAETIRDVAVNDAKALPAFVDIIARHAERLGALVDDLMELSRIESREIMVELQPVDLIAMIEQSVSLFDERASKRGQSLDVVLPECLPRVLADSYAIDHVLTNLIDNAVKYSGRSAAIRITAELRGDKVQIGVEDTGPGIAEEHLPRLFERFYRVDNGRSREQGGTGLGLSIVRHLVEAMGSSIEVESTLGVGTRFYFLLPVAEPLALHGDAE